MQGADPLARGNAARHIYSTHTLFFLHTNGTLFLFFHPCIVTLQLFYKFARLLASLAQW